MGEKNRTAPVPSSLSHYTDLAGLIGIVESGYLWASNVSFLNDRREIAHGLEASVAALKTFYSNKIYKHWQPYLDAAVDEFLSGVVPHTYAVCLCASSDVLSQWRGYGGITQGIAVTFDREKLSEAFESDKALLYRVNYGNVTAKDKFSTRLKEALDELDSQGNLPSTPKKIVARRVMSRLLPQFKHYGFREEREWRYVVQQASVRESVCYRAKANVIIPYLKLGHGTQGSLPIKSITVGPGRDQALTAKSIEMFLSKTPYSDLPIKLSQVPYRM